jgi:hypothetical protein
VRRAIAVSGSILLLSFLAAATAPARELASGATCKAGYKRALVGGAFTCLKVGLACATKHQPDYERSGFVCRGGRLRAGATTTLNRPAAGPGSSRANPVPLGKPGSLGNGWTLTVTGVNFDATSAILAADPGNKPPLPEFQYVLVAVSATYGGPGSSHLTPGTSFRAIGASGFAHSMSNSYCGQLPSPNLDMTNPLVFKGGTISGYAACWMVSKADLASLQLYYQPLLATAQVWFALH